MDNSMVNRLLEAGFTSENKLVGGDGYLQVAVNSKKGWTTGEWVCTDTQVDLLPEFSRGVAVDISGRDFQKILEIETEVSGFCLVELELYQTEDEDQAFVLTLDPNPEIEEADDEPSKLVMFLTSLQAFKLSKLIAEQVVRGMHKNLAVQVEGAEAILRGLAEQLELGSRAPWDSSF